LPEIEIRVPEREKNWKDVFVQAVQEYQSRRRKRPFIALGQYVEEANYRDTPIMYMESLGYIVFMGELHKASSYSNMKFFCDQTRAYVTNSEWVKYNKNPGSPISDAPVLP